MIDICICETVASTNSQSHGPEFDLIPEAMERMVWRSGVPMCVYGSPLHEVRNNGMGATEHPLTYWIPMHILGPLLNGTKAISILLVSPGSAVSQREGRKV